MFTDMVGYSSLTQRNEALALQLLEEHRNILRPLFVKHEGREIETAGDAFFVEFTSAVEATVCAIEIQKHLFERNKPEEKDRRIVLRIGIHIGDVVYAGKHVHGDGVNIAARLEPLAQPGGICISEDVARQIRNKVEYPAVKKPREKLKNISMPVEIYCIALPWLSEIKKKRHFIFRRSYAVALTAALLIAAFILFKSQRQTGEPPISKVRLAVIPLKNISIDAQDEYFADGMTEELISTLSKINGLNVIARTSSMKYKQTNKSTSEIGQELMVGNILLGSVRKSGNRAKITVQLVDTRSQENLWSDDYDRELSDIFLIQSQIAQQIAEQLKIALVPFERQQLNKWKTDNMIAYQQYLVGNRFLNQRTPESIQNAIQYFEKSISLDSTFVLPYPRLSYCYTLMAGAGYGNLPRSVAEKKARQAVMKALAIDPMLAEAHAALGYVKFRIDWNWSDAKKEFEKAIELQPGYAPAHEWNALFLAVQDKLDEALVEMNKAYVLDPMSASVNNGLARLYYFRNDTANCFLQLKKAFEIEPDYAEGHFTAGMAYLKAKKYSDSERELKRALELSNRRPVILSLLGINYAITGKTREARQIITELQAPPLNNDKLYAIAAIKSYTGQPDAAAAIFKKLVDEKYGVMVYMKVEKSFFKHLDPKQYQQMLASMGF
jgi:adenylate cyclase